MSFSVVSHLSNEGSRMVSLAPPSLFLVSDVGSPDGRRDRRGKDRSFIAQEEEEEEEARSLFARFLRGESAERRRRGTSSLEEEEEEEEEEAAL